MSDHTIHDLAEAYERRGYTVAEVSDTFGYIEFSKYETNYHSLSKIAHERGFVITAWNPDRDNPRLYFSTFEIVEETETRTTETERTVMNVGPEKRSGPTTFVLDEETRQV